MNESFLDLSRFVRQFMSIRKIVFFVFYFECDLFFNFYFSTFSESERINAFNMRNGIDPKKEEDQVRSLRIQKYHFHFSWLNITPWGPSIMLKWDESFHCQFSPNSACGSSETTTREDAPHFIFRLLK